MDLTLSDEQSMLRESALRFVRDSSGDATLDSAALWSTFAELGWLALPIPEEDGGLGGTLVDVTVLLEELGKGAFSTSYVETAVMCAGLIAALGTEAQKAAILPDVAAGERRLAFAHVEPGPRGGLRTLQTRAVPEGNEVRLSGSKIAVPGDGVADTLLVSGRMDDRTVVLLVPKGTTGVSLTGYASLGGGTAATVTFDDVLLPAEAVLGADDAGHAIELVSDTTITALCAEAVGMMSALLQATVGYVGTREQFGKPLTANQSVRFKLADMEVALEEARSMMLRAALAIDGSPRDRIRAVAGAKAGIGKRGKLVAELTIQLHGAMGVTEELTVGGYYKRLLAFDAMFGGVDHQLVRHARATGRLAPTQEAA